MADEHDPTSPPDHRLSDGRADLGERFDRPIARGDRELGDGFATAAAAASDAPGLGASFADPAIADRAALGRSFADPNSADDGRLGRSFEATESSAGKHHRPAREVVAAPFKKPGSKRIVWLTVAVLLVVFLLVLFFGWLPRHSRGKEAQQQADKQNQAPEVAVVKVQRAKDGGGLTVPGTTTPYIEASVYARASGYLKARFVDIGDHVHKGQLLAIIDAPDLDQQVDQARQQLRQAEAQVAQQNTQLALTRVTTDRYRALVERGVFSRQDGDQQEANYQSQRANVASAERNVEAFRANLRRVIALQSYERVTAPFDGVVTQRNVDDGALINAQGAAGSSAPTPAATGQQPTSTTQNASTNNSGSSGTGNNLASPSGAGGASGGPLFTIAQVNQLRILVSVPEGYQGSVRPGTHATLHFQEFGDQVFYGDVARTAGSIDQNTRTLLVEIVIANRDNRLLAGMYAVATFAAVRGSGPLVVSGEAIGIRNDRPTVAVIGSDDTVHLQPVTIGRDYGSEVEIVAGLREGETIASTFTDEVTEGRKVNPQMDKKQQQKAGEAQTAIKPRPPGGSTQYGDPGLEDQDMQGQNAKPQQKQPGGGAKKAAGKTGSQR